MKFIINLFLDLKIAWKLIIGYAAVGFLLVVGTGVGLLTTNNFKDRLISLYSDHFVPNEQLSNIMANGYQIQIELGSFLSQQSKYESTLGSITSSMDVIEKQINAFAQNPRIDQENLSALQSSWKEYQAKIAAIETEMASGKIDQAGVLYRGDLTKSWGFFKTAIQNNKQENLLSINGEVDDSKAGFIQIVWFLVIAGGVGVAISQVVGIVVAGTIVKPLKTVDQQLMVLSGGGNANEADLKKNSLITRRDELGELARSLSKVNEYMQSVALMADQISTGNLVVEVKPRSAQDQLGQALLRMVEQLSRLVKQVAANSNEVGNASKRLAEAASQTNLASGQISTTIQEVAMGMNQQNADMGQTRDVIQDTNRAIALVAKGAEEQERAVGATRRAAEQMNKAIQQMVFNVKAVSDSTLVSTSKAEDGASTLQQTVNSMVEIRTQVDELNSKMSTVGSRSDEIGSIIDVIEEIATKTNILAINATIEAAHAEVQARKLTEEMLDMMMIAECHMVNQILIQHPEELDEIYWSEVCASANLDMILITDGDGVTVQCNDTNLLGWRFPEDPKAQAYPFRQLLMTTDGFYCQESMPRSVDKQPYKFVGTSRKDTPGIIQVGFKMSSMKKFDLRVQGFAVVASEVYQLAEQARQSTREIRQLIKGIQASIEDAVTAMQKSSQEVEIGMKRAGQAGSALHQILEAVQEVSRQVNSAFEATEQMHQISQSLEKDVLTFGRIVGENNSAVTDLNSGYGHITHTIEAVSSLSQQNSAAAEQVSASSQQMRAQMEEVSQAASELEEMAEDLEELVLQFQY